MDDNNTEGPPELPVSVAGGQAPGSEHPNFADPGYQPPAGYPYAQPAPGPTGALPGSNFPGAQPTPEYPGPSQPTPGSQWPRTYSPLTRSRYDRMIGGVCGGLARYWNTDPVLLRILAVVLTLATGGAFILVYLIAWLLIRDEPYPPAAYGPGFVAGGNPGYGTPGTPGYLAPYDGSLDQQAWAARPARSYLGWLAVSAAVLLAGLMGVIALLVGGGAAMFAITCALMLAVLGVGLLIGTTRGRARWLVIPAIPLAFIAWGAVSASNWSATVPDVTASGSSLSDASRVWTVTAADANRVARGGSLDYRLGLGEATLDLTELAAPNGRGGARVPIAASVGLGQLIVLLPRDASLELRATVQAGEVVLPPDVKVTGTGSNPEDPTSGQNLKVTAKVPPTEATPNQPDGGYVIELDAAIGAGQLEVRRAKP